MDNPQRPETGPMQFGQDWNGVFIRGDNAGYMAFELGYLRDAIQNLLKTRDVDQFESKIGGPLSGGVYALNSVIDDLASSGQHQTSVAVQHMKPFTECFSELSRRET